MSMESVSSYFAGSFGGIIMSLIAVSIVFLVIIGLMLLMMCLKHFAKMVEPKETCKPMETEPVIVYEPVTKAMTTVNESLADDELVAVITAAITAFTGTAANILSFAPSNQNETRTGRGTPAWRMTSILLNSKGLRD